MSQPTDRPAGRPGAVSSMRAGPLALRASAEPDMDFVLAAESHPDNAKHVEQWSRAEHLACVRGGHGAHWILERAEDGEPVGYLILEGLDDPDHSLLLRRVVIARKGRGYGRAAVALAARYCFEVLGFHRLWLTVALDNHRAADLYRRMGFVEEGIARESAHKHGRYVSMRVMSLLAAEYAAGAARFRPRPG